MGRVRAVVVGIVVALGPSTVASACPNCKEAIAAQPGEAARMQNGYNYSILLMLAVPFTLLGTGAWFVGRAVKQGVLPEL
jgi:hypothetical protein